MQPTAPTQYRPKTFQVDTPQQKSKAYRTLNFYTEPNRFHPISKAPLPVNQRHQQVTFVPLPNNNYMPGYHPSTLAQNGSYQLKPQSQQLISSSNALKSTSEAENEQVGDKLTKAVGKFERYTNSQTKSNKAAITQKIDHQKLINEVMDQFKKRLFPSIIKCVKQELADDLQQLRMEIKSLRQEVRSEAVSQSFIISQIKGQITMLSNSQDGYISDIKENLMQKSSSLQLLQDKYGQMDQLIKVSLDKQAQQFRFMSAAIDCHRGIRMESLKADQTKCCFSTTTRLEYKQSLRVKGEAAREQMVVFVCEYNIDPLGYLLDSQSCYLLDENGSQIQLQQEHMRILQLHHIIHP